MSKCKEEAVSRGFYVKLRDSMQAMNRRFDQLDLTVECISGDVARHDTLIGSHQRGTPQRVPRGGRGDRFY